MYVLNSVLINIPYTLMCYLKIEGHIIFILSKSYIKLKINLHIKIYTEVHRGRHGYELLLIKNFGNISSDNVITQCSALQVVHWH